MKYTLLFILVLFASCSDDVPALKDCRLTQITITGNNSVTKNTYTYNASGKMHTEVRTRNEAPIFDYAFSYNADGKVDRVDKGIEYAQHEYAADGKIASVKTFSTAGDLKRTFTYNWSGDNVEILFTKSDTPNTDQIINLEFLNENIVKKTVHFYSGAEPNVLQSTQVSNFEDFDSKLSSNYIASLTRPGYAVELAKNNAGKVIYHTTIYDEDGAIIQESISTDLYTYTYNSGNATVSSHALLNDASIVLDTQIQYDHCGSVF